MTNASAQEILYVQEHPRSFPGVRATTVTVRSYTPAGKAAANLLGYVGRITASEYRALKSHGYRPDSHYSASG